MKIVITGASGLVGNAVLEAAVQRGMEVIALSNSHGLPKREKVTVQQLDLTHADAVDRLLLDTFPDVIVNAAAASSPAAVDADPTLAEKLNVALPRRLAQLANHLNARLIHLSTDMVFDGTAAPYRSTDMPCPGNLYGQLKLMAEREVLRAGANFATVLRIAIVTGDSPSGQRSVHEKLFHQWAEGKKVKLYNDELRQPVATTSIAELVTELIERPNLHGVFHWAGSDALTRYAMGVRIARHFALDPDKLIEVASSPDERATDLRMELQPLQGKVRTQPMDFADQLEHMHVPVSCHNWYASVRGITADSITSGVRLVKGRDF